MLSNTGALQDLLLVPTPAHDTTRMVHDSQCVGEGWPPVVLSLLQPAHTSHSSLYSSLLLDKTTLGGEDSTMVENSTMKGNFPRQGHIKAFTHFITVIGDTPLHSVLVCKNYVLCVVGGDLITAFHRELSAHSGSSQCLELVAALEKV